MTPRERMLEAPPLGLLLRMATPNAVAFGVQASVSIAEVWLVSRLGTVPLAALALMFPALMLMQTLSNGAMGGAVSSAIARALGADRRERAERLVWHAIALAVALGGAFSLLWFAFGERLLTMLAVPEDVTTEARAYGNVLFSGTILIWLFALLGSAVRGTGDMRYPARLMIAGSVVQVAVAAPLVLGLFGLPSLGLAGAAIAVLVVSLLNTGLLLRRLFGAQSPLRPKRTALRLEPALFADILRVGALASLSPVFVILTTSMVNALLAPFGLVALAAYGIVARLEFLLIPLVFGIGVAMTAVVGTCIGAGRVERAQRVGWTGGGVAAGLAGTVGIAFALFPGLWMGLYTTDPEVFAVGARYFAIVGPAFGFVGLGLSLYFASQGAGTVVWPVIAMVLRFAIGVGGATVAVGSFGAGLDGVFACLAVGMVVYGVLTAASLVFGAWRRAAARSAV